MLVMFLLLVHDEEKCIHFFIKGVCDADEFNCASGSPRCIYAHWECDNYNDCEDGSDEAHCECS